jgi:hypothetical protein
MNTSAIKRMEIVNLLALVPDDSPDKIKAFVDGLVSETGHSKPANLRLEGIWKDKGFEGIVDLEAEIAEIRGQESPSIP